MESPQSHESEFGQTFRVAKEGAPGKQNPKLFPLYSYVWSQTLKPSASPSDEQRKPGSNQSLENGLVEGTKQCVYYTYYRVECTEYSVEYTGYTVECTEYNME